MKTKSPKGNIIWKPTRDEIANLSVGDMALDCFGRENKIVSIFFEIENLKGELCKGYYTELGHGASISHSVTEGEIVSTLPLINEYNRIDNIRI